MRASVILLVLVAAWLAAGCGSSGSTGAACVPGKVEACACAGGGQGVQSCLADGTGFGPCTGCPAEPDVAAGEATLTDAGKDMMAAEADAAVTPPDTVTGLDSAFFDGQQVSDVLAPDANPSHACEPCGYGSLTGKVCAPNEQVFVPHALVTVDVIDCDGAAKQFQAWSDADGTYHFDSLPCGVHTVVVTAGSFSTTYQVQIKTGQETDHTGVGLKQCFHAQSVRIAVLWGQWDELQDLLADLGFDTTYYNFEDEYFNDTPTDQIEAVKLLRDPEKLAAFDLIFLNCGSAALKYVKKYQEIGDNLRDFVLSGGSLYASDLSWAYLEAAFPDAVDFYGADDLPNTAMAVDGPQQAEGQQTVPAFITDPVLAAHLGATTFDAKYGPGPLIVVKAAGPDTVAHVMGTVKILPDEWLDNTTWKGPLVVSHQPSQGSGRIVYTTFHNDEQADALMLKILYYLVFLL